MYEEHDSGVTDRSTARTRAKETHLKLVYQWAIQLANALEFVHSHSFEEPAPKISIISGDFNIDSCWLSSSGSSISLLGFLRSEFRTRSSPLHLGEVGVREAEFRPFVEQPTMQTDLFL
jgi:hypothetical protein